MTLARKPDSVLCDHLSMLSTHNLAGQAHNGCLLEIAHWRVCHTRTFTNPVVGSYSTISPFPPTTFFHKKKVVGGGILSVALSVPSRDFSLKKPEGYSVQLSPSVRTFLPEVLQKGIPSRRSLGQSH